MDTTRRDLPALKEAKDAGKMPGIQQVFDELSQNLSGNEAEYNYPRRVKEKSNLTHSLNFWGQGRPASSCALPSQTCPGGHCALFPTAFPAPQPRRPAPSGHSGVIWRMEEGMGILEREYRQIV